MIGTALVLPSPRALLPPVSRQDPVAELRATSERAIKELLGAQPGELWVVAEGLDEASRERGVEVPLGHRVAGHLLESTGADPGAVREVVAGPDAVDDLRRADGALLVMADGSARRHEKAPGHFHPEAIDFDEAIETALRDGDAGALAALDPAQGEELWCHGVPALHVLAAVARDRRVTAELLHAEAPYGVAWWVARWNLG